MEALVFRVELSESDPLIWRRFIVPAHITFLQLHKTLQFVMGWYDSHLHQFVFEDTNTIITNNQDDVEETKVLKELYLGKTLSPSDQSYPFIKRRLERNVYPSARTKLLRFLTSNSQFTYEYDFGDSWIHHITFLGMIDDYELNYPEILEGEGDCPPENVGGIGGYAYFQSVMNDPTNPEFREYRKWAKSQHWIRFNIRQINAWMRDEFGGTKKTKKASEDSILKIDNELSRLKIGQPAARALLSIGIRKLDQLPQHTQAELMALHGFGPKALNILKEALNKAQLDFKPSTETY